MKGIGRRSSLTEVPLKDLPLAVLAVSGPPSNFSRAAGYLAIDFFTPKLFWNEPNVAKVVPMNQRCTYMRN